MPRRVTNRTFSVDDQTDLDIRRLSKETELSQSEFLRETVRVYKTLLTLVDTLTAEQHNPNRAIRIAVIPQGYRMPPGIPAGVISIPTGVIVGSPVELIEHTRPTAPAASRLDT